MKSILNMRHITYFLSVAENRSISAAAQALGMAQPSLSECIARLEQHFATKLVIRSARGIELTEAGVTLVEFGKRLLELAETLEEEVQKSGDEVAGSMTVALPPTIGLILSVPLAETVLTELPKVRLHVTEGMSRYILKLIEDERAQLGIVYDTADSALFVSQPLMTEEMFVVTAPDNWPGEIGPDGKALEAIGLEELERLPLVLPHSSHGARTIAERAVKSAGMTLNVVAEIDALPQIIEVVERASAYSLLSQAAVLSQVARGTVALVPIRGAKLRRTAYLVRKWGRPLSARDQAVQTVIGEIMQELIERFGLSAVLHGQEAGTAQS